MLINRKTTARVWRFSNEKYDEKFVKKVTECGGGSIGVSGFIGQQDGGCCATYPGRLKTENYIDLIENNLISSFELLTSSDNASYFQQDGKFHAIQKKLSKRGSRTMTSQFSNCLQMAQI